MVNLKNLMVGIGAFSCLAFLGENDARPQAENQTQSTGRTQVQVESYHALSKYQVVENFSIMNGERATVWLENDSVIFKDGSVYYVSNQDEEITISEQGNYILLENKR